MSETHYTTLPSPIGELLLAGERDRLTRLSMQAGPRPFAIPTHWRRDDAVFVRPRQQLEEYFDGRRRRFELELEPTGSDFDVTVWTAMRDIP